MLDSAAPRDPNPAPGLDPAVALPADAYWHLVRTLRLTLPPPPSDTPEDWLRRDRAAIARIAALVPANAAEAELAAQFVAASEYWKDCLRLANLAETSEPPNAASEAPAKAGATPEWAAKCRAQALAMMRQANAALRLLLRLQDRRAKIEADNAACDRLAWTEHRAIRLMAEALSDAPLAPSRPAAHPDAGIVAQPPAAVDPPEAPLANPGQGAGEAEPPSAPETATPEHHAPSPHPIDRLAKRDTETTERRHGQGLLPERIGSGEKLRSAHEHAVL